MWAKAEPPFLEYSLRRGETLKYVGPRRNRETGEGEYVYKSSKDRDILVVVPLPMKKLLGEYGDIAAEEYEQAKKMFSLRRRAAKIKP